MPRRLRIRAVKKSAAHKYKIEINEDIDIKSESIEINNSYDGIEEASKEGMFIDINIKSEPECLEESSSGYESTLQREQVDAAINQIIASEEDLNDLIPSAIVRHDPTDERLLLEEPVVPASVDDSEQQESYEPSDIEKTSDKKTLPINNKNAKTKKRKSFKCDLCNYSSNYQSMLKSHTKYHLKSEDLRCPECGHYFTTVYKMREHYRTHTGEKPYKCEICGFSTSYPSSYKYHMRSHRGEKPYACSQCSFRAVSCTMLTRHKRVHTGEKPFECHLCDYKARAKGTLKSHLRIHTGEKPFSCNYCDKSFVTSSAVRKHLLVHLKNKDYKCSLCDVHFITRTLLREHLATHGVYIHCEHCGTKPGSTARLGKHLEKSRCKAPLKCSVCEKEFEFKCAYGKHLQTHDECRPFKCDKCDYKGPSSASLRFHKRDKHSGRQLRTFKCDDCSMVYYTKAELIKHLCVRCQ